ncbi:hypothetical protein COO60DRAFT_211477 [Scenedesmus sp. NREL 46B-D3]|nr:hypothetical protein COO60DRAFT_211477 [Scenedesmus sp. NREL 46B-D3]
MLLLLPQRLAQVAVVPAVGQAAVAMMLQWAGCPHCWAAGACCQHSSSCACVCPASCLSEVGQLCRSSWFRAWQPRGTCGGSSSSRARLGVPCSASSGDVFSWVCDWLGAVGARCRGASAAQLLQFYESFLRTQVAAAGPGTQAAAAAAWAALLDQSSRQGEVTGAIAAGGGSGSGSGSGSGDAAAGSGRGELAAANASPAAAAGHAADGDAEQQGETADPDVEAAAADGIADAAEGAQTAAGDTNGQALAAAAPPGVGGVAAPGAQHLLVVPARLRGWLRCWQGCRQHRRRQRQALRLQPQLRQQRQRQCQVQRGSWGAWHRQLLITSRLPQPRPRLHSSCSSWPRSSSSSWNSSSSSSSSSCSSRQQLQQQQLIALMMFPGAAGLFRG